MNDQGGFILLFIIIAVVITIGSRVFDSDRIKSYIEDRGGQLLEKRWTPFGKGWYGDQNRIYEVRYRDADGNEHQASCKTSIFSGVYWTDDQIIHYAKRPEIGVSLQEENKRLRREIERLKRSK